MTLLPSSHPHSHPPPPLQPAVTRQKRQTRAHLALIHGHSHRNRTRREGPCGPGSGNHTPPKGLFVILTALCGPHGSSLASCPPESTRTGSWPAAVDMSTHAARWWLQQWPAGLTGPPLPPSAACCVRCWVRPWVTTTELARHHIRPAPLRPLRPLLSFFSSASLQRLNQFRSFPSSPFSPSSFHGAVLCLILQN